MFYVFAIHWAKCRRFLNGRLSVLCLHVVYFVDISITIYGIDTLQASIAVAVRVLCSLLTSCFYLRLHAKLADLEQRQAASKELLLLLTNASRTEWSALMALYPKITLFINCFHLACPRGQWTSHTGNPYITSPTTPTGFLLLRRLIIRLSECVRVRKGCSQRT